jgi:hypothetical protein
MVAKEEGGVSPTGYATTAEVMRALGFTPLELQFRPTAVELPDGPACEWTTVGEVPRGPGLYAFTLGGDDDLKVMYVGLTEELWMVSKGRLPEGGARPGQRYGRPRYAGITRQRINALIAARHGAGDLIRHWVRPLSDPPQDRAGVRSRLLQEEQALISQWDLRRVGWNRG